MFSLKKNLLLHVSMDCSYRDIILLCHAVFVPGTVDKGVVEVTNCFAVPHNESDDEVNLHFTWDSIL